MHKPRGLGRGLGALFPGSGAAVALEPRAGSPLLRLEVEKIKPNPLQPRRHFDEAALASLAQSIATHGLLAPIIVRRDPALADRYEIITGERRWRAAKLAGETTIAAIVREADTGEAVELAILENVQRTDLNPIEEASGYRALIEEHGYTQDELGRRIGKSRPAVTNALRLLTLPDSVQALVRDGKLSAGHARALVALPASRAHILAHEAVRDSWSVRELERKSAAPQSSKPSPAGGRKALPPDLAEAENRLRFALATRVALHPRGPGGTIEIHYVDEGDLTRLLDRVAPQEHQ